MLLADNRRYGRSRWSLCIQRFWRIGLIFRLTIIISAPVISAVIDLLRLDPFPCLLSIDVRLVQICAGWCSEPFDWSVTMGQKTQRLIKGGLWELTRESTSQTGGRLDHRCPPFSRRTCCSATPKRHPTSDAHPLPDWLSKLLDESISSPFDGCASRCTAPRWQRRRCRPRGVFLNYLYIGLHTDIRRGSLRRVNSFKTVPLGFLDSCDDEMRFTPAFTLESRYHINLSSSNVFTWSGLKNPAT